MTNNSEDKARAELHSLYQHIEQEQPSKMLDKTVLELAAANVKPQLKSQSFWRKHRWPLSSAASVLVVVTLFVINPQMQLDDTGDATPALTSTPTETPAPTMMRSVTPERVDANRATADSISRDEKSATKLHSSAFNDSQHRQKLAQQTETVKVKLDEITVILSQQEFEKAKQQLEQLHNDYEAIFKANEQLENRFVELERQLDTQLP